MNRQEDTCPQDTVALLAEGVDRNSEAKAHTIYAEVALLAEGVDRNHTKISDKTVQIPVALLAEGVDRNKKLLTNIKSVVCRPPRGGRG